MAQLTPDFFNKILQIEGGYQDHRNDTGNYCGGSLIGTKYGVSAVALGQWWGRCPTVAEMKALTTDQAFSFYAWYGDVWNLYAVENQTLFELLYNNTMGSPRNAAKIEQRVLNSYGYNISVDGVRGPLTIAALNDAWRKHGPRFYNSVRSAWINYLKSLNSKDFEDGWMNRMLKFPPLAVATGGFTSIAIAALIFLFLNRK